MALANDVLKTKTDFNNLLGTLRKDYEQAGKETTLTAEDLFGEQLRRGRDAIGQNANITKRNLARATMAQGGDVSGASAVGMLGADEQANSAIGNMESSFADKVLQENNRAKAREMQLLSQLLGGTGQLASMNQSADQFDRNMDLQKSMFNRQMRLQKGQAWMSFLGDVLGMGSNIGAAKILSCWIATALFGARSYKTILIRRWLHLFVAEPKTFRGWFSRWYLFNGEAVAAWLNAHAWAKPPVRWAFNRLFKRVYHDLSVEGGF